MCDLQQRKREGEKGFVLVAAIIMLALLTLLSLSMFFTSRTATQASGAAQTATEAYYYAETGINYIAWALANDAEFDSYANYPGSHDHAAFNEPLVDKLGDYNEWYAYQSHPGPTAISDVLTDGTTGQVRYFDNTPMEDRSVCFQDDAAFSNCIDVQTAPADRVAPTMYHISTSLPRYIKLEIDSTGAITPSIPKLPHQNPPVKGQDIPTNGAVVWLTAGDVDSSEKDIEIFPLDPAGSYAPDGILPPSDCTGGALPNCPCDISNITSVSAAVACNAHTGEWVSSYKIVAYAIGYVNGKASQMIRAVIR